jgi:hypothetical protein
MLREQQALQARWGGTEQAAAAVRARVLVNQGYGPLLGWLQHPGQHSGEPPARAAATATTGRSLADLFDEAA